MARNELGKAADGFSLNLRFKNKKNKKMHLKHHYSTGKKINTNSRGLCSTTGQPKMKWKERKYCKGFPQFRYDPITTRITNTNKKKRYKFKSEEKSKFHKKWNEIADRACYHKVLLSTYLCMCHLCMCVWKTLDIPHWVRLTALQLNTSLGCNYLLLQLQMKKKNTQQIWQRKFVAFFSFL